MRKLKKNCCVNNGVKKRIELEGFGCDLIVFHLFPIAPIFLLVCSFLSIWYPPLSLAPLQPWKDLLIWTCICVWVLILEACQVYLCVLSWVHWVTSIYLKHLRETLIVCICEALLLLIHLLNWLTVFHGLNCLDDSVSICFHWLYVELCLCLSLSRFCENCATLFLFCESVLSVCRVCVTSLMFE